MQPAKCPGWDVIPLYGMHGMQIQAGSVADNLMVAWFYSETVLSHRLCLVYLVIYNKEAKLTGRNKIFEDNQLAEGKRKITINPSFLY